MLLRILTKCSEFDLKFHVYRVSPSSRLHSIHQGHFKSSFSFWIIQKESCRCLILSSGHRCHEYFDSFYHLKVQIFASYAIDMIGSAWEFHVISSQFPLKLSRFRFKSTHLNRLCLTYYAYLSTSIFWKWIQFSMLSSSFSSISSQHLRCSNSWLFSPCHDYKDGRTASFCSSNCIFVSKEEKYIRRVMISILNSNRLIYAFRINFQIQCLLNRVEFSICLDTFFYWMGWNRLLFYRKIYGHRCQQNTFVWSSPKSKGIWKLA